MLRLYYIGLCDLYYFTISRELINLPSCHVQSTQFSIEDFILQFLLLNNTS